MAAFNLVCNYHIYLAFYGIVKLSLLWILICYFSTCAHVADRHFNICCVCRFVIFCNYYQVIFGPCISFEVEAVRNSVSFMSELDSFYLGSIGLLGEYRPTSRKKHTCFSEQFGHFHLETIRDFIVIKSHHFMLPAFFDIHPQETSHPPSCTVHTV